MSAANTSSIKSKTNKSVAGSVATLARKSTAPSALSRGQTVEYTLRGASSKSLVKSASKSRSRLTAMKSNDGSRRSSLKPSRTGSALPSRTASRDASRNASRTGLASSAASRTSASRSNLSVPRSSRSRQTRSQTSTKTPSYNTVSNSRRPASKSRSTYLETPSGSKSRSKFTIPTQKSGVSKANTQYKLRNVQTCAGKTNAWEPVSQGAPKSARSGVSKSMPSMVSLDVRSQKPHPKDIVIEEREVTRTRYSWWALSILAFLLCATLIFLIVKEVVESSDAEPTTNNNSAQPAQATSTEGTKQLPGKK